MIPFFALSFAVSLLGFAIIVYLLGKWIYNFIGMVALGLSSGINPVSGIEIAYLPDVFTFLGLFILVLSVIGVKIGLGATKEKAGGLKGVASVIIYISLYITVFPIILIHSFWKMAKKEKVW